MITTCCRVLTAAALACAPSLAIPTSAAGSGPSAPDGWSPRTVLTAPTGWPVDVEVARDGSMAATWGTPDAIEVAWREPGGAWSAPEQATTGGDRACLGVDRDGTFYLAWTVEDGKTWKLKEKHTLPTDQWSHAVTVLRHDSPASILDYDVASDGSASAAVRMGASTIVKTRSADGAWGSRTRWPYAVNIDVALGGRGSAAAVLTVFRPYAGQPDLGVRIVEVTRQRAGHAWSAPQVLERERDRSYGPGWPGSASITVDRAGTSTVAYYGTVPSRPQMGVATSSARLGGSWSKPRLAIPRMGSEHPIEVAAARDRSVLVVAVRSYSIVLSALRPLGGGWRSPTTVAHQAIRSFRWARA